MAKQRPKPSHETTVRARFKRALKFHEYELNDGYCEIISVWFNRVELRFAGYYFEFVRDENGRITRGPGRYTYIQPEDYAFLFAFAKTLMQSVGNGSRKAADERKKNNPQLPLLPEELYGKTPEQQQMAFMESLPPSKEAEEPLEIASAPRRKLNDDPPF